jgi:hypothetical protein
MFITVLPQNFQSAFLARKNEEAISIDIASSQNPSA